MTNAQLAAGAALGSTVYRETYSALVAAGWAPVKAHLEASSARNRATERVKRLFSRGNA